MTAADGDEETFAIPVRPERRYPRRGGVEYEGETVFALAPHPEQSDETLQALLEDVLADEPYTYGDWFDVPMPLYLVKDHETGDVFRVAIRDGEIQFHVRPSTESAGLRALYVRLRAADEDLDWSVTCHTDRA